MPFNLIYFRLSEFLCPCTLNFLNNSAYWLGVWHEDTLKKWFATSEKINSIHGLGEVMSNTMKNVLSALSKELQE